MADYVERETLVDNLELLAQHKDKFRQSVILGVVDTIRAMESADVAEIRHGHWENGNPICPVCGENKFKDLDADIWCDWQPKYCPNCGARLDLEE